AQPPWWRSLATSPVAHRVLARVFSRTAAIACLQMATRAAEREHDVHIAHRGAYHLFRLPAGHEAIIFEALQREPLRNSLVELIALEDRDARLSILSNLARGETAVAGNGPIGCGMVSDLQEADLLPRIV